MKPVPAACGGGTPADERAWSPDEDQQLLAAFNEGLTVAGLACEHECSTEAIRNRLVYLGRPVLRRP